MSGKKHLLIVGPNLAIDHIIDAHEFRVGQV